jgi:hypothetical protein
MAEDWKDWQCPPAATDESRRIGWLNEAADEGMAWLKSQRGYSDIRKTLAIIAGTDFSGNMPSYRSRVNPNRLKKNIRVIVGALAKLRPTWGYSSDNKAYLKNAEMMNKVTRAWYLESFADLSIKEGLSYAAATNRGWVCPVYRRDMGGTGHGDIRLLTYGSPCVLPVQLPSTGNFQEAYCVTILDELPVYMAHGMYPQFQSRLLPKSSRYWYSDDGVRKAARGNVIQRIFGKNPRTSGAEELTDLLVPMRRAYVIDLTVNTTKQEIPMGEPGSSWAYKVPYVGQDIPVGRDSKSGSITYRKADENDARLYPRRRLLISSDSCITYDGPAFDWHGMFPGVSFSVDAWPWEPLGFSLAHDGYEINEAIKEIARGNMDKIRAQLRPSMAFDTNTVSMKEARAMDPFAPDNRVGFDGSASEGDPFRQILAPEAIKVSPESMAFLQWLEQTLDSQQAVQDAMTLAKLRTVGSMDELEKMLEAQGPIIEDMSRSMEPPMRDLGVMIKYLICQYYTTARVMQWVGADGVTRETFDYDPSSLVPSHSPGEDPDSPSLKSPIERAKVFADNLRFFILPNSLHEMTQMAMKLGLIQLKKSGVMVDSQTIAESWQIANYGTIDGNTVIEKFHREKEMELEMMARMKKISDEVGLTPPGGPPGAAGPGKPNPEGRPPTGQAAPKLESKGGGVRSTISESK